jgi:hypothetical protein
VTIDLAMNEPRVYACFVCGRCAPARFEPEGWLKHYHQLVCSTECLSKANADKCHAWIGRPGERGGYICSLIRGHACEHIAIAITVCERWANNLDKMTRVESAAAMAAYVGASQEQILVAEGDGRAQAHGGGYKRQPMEALDFLFLEAYLDERERR